MTPEYDRHKSQDLDLELNSERIIITLDDLMIQPGFLTLVSKLKNRCIVANGCFDILHPGHLSLLASLDTTAYRQKLRPVVALNSDYSIRNIKGNRRPIVPQESRAKLLTSLKWPFTVVIFDEDSPQRLMDFLQPAVVMKGSEYPPDSVVRWSGSEVVSVDMVPRWSTSMIVGDTR